MMFGGESTVHWDVKRTNKENCINTGRHKMAGRCILSGFGKATHDIEFTNNTFYGRPVAKEPVTTSGEAAMRG